MNEISSSYKKKFSNISLIFGLVIVVISTIFSYSLTPKIVCERKNVVILLYLILFSNLSVGVYFINSNLYGRGRGLLLLYFGVFALTPLFPISLYRYYSSSFERLFIIYFFYGIPWPVLSSVTSILLGLNQLYKEKKFPKRYFSSN